VVVGELVPVAVGELVSEVQVSELVSEVQVLPPLPGIEVLGKDRWCPYRDTTARKPDRCTKR